MIYQLGMKTIEIAQSPDGWRVRRYIWPTSVKGDPVFRSEAEAVAAVQGSSGRSLKPMQPSPTVEPAGRLPSVPTTPDSGRPRGRLIPAQAPPVAPRAPKTGKLDSFRHLMGVLPDAEVAKLSGATTLGVRKHRDRHGIPAAPKKAAAPVVEEVLEVVKPITPSELDAHAEIVGVLPDEEVADRAGVTGEEVRRYRVGLRLRRSKLDLHQDIVGVLSDREVAERVGIIPDGVRKYRVARGIPAARDVDRTAPASPIPDDAVPLPASEDPRAAEPVAAPGAEPEVPGSVDVAAPSEPIVEVQPVEDVRRLTAFTLVAVRGDERETFVVLAVRMSEALAKAEAALSRGPGEPWEVVEMRAGGIGLA